MGCGKEGDEVVMGGLWRGKRGQKKKLVMGLGVCELCGFLLSGLGVLVEGCGWKGFWLLLLGLGYVFGMGVMSV